MKTALIVVDVQRDFCEGGSLAVEGGNEVGHGISSLIRTGYYDDVVFTMDWHDPDSDNGGHFSDNPDFVDSWPVHCTANSAGSELHVALRDLAEDAPVFKKGFGRPDYSGFQGTYNNQSLNDYLKSNEIKRVHVAGIAGDYCVKQTALDSVRHGYDTLVLPSLVASVGGEVATMKTIFDVVVLEREMKKNDS